jgi:NADH-quinone oxidoreductase subunit C
MALTNELVQELLVSKFGDQVTAFSTETGMLSFEAPAANNLKVLQYLNEDPALGFTFLTDICAVNYPDNNGSELVVVYHLHNLKENIRLRFSVAVPLEKPDVFTATKIFESANWMERETYDFFGINFIGHPNLKRVLNVDEMDYFPLRKAYPLEDQTRIDKDDEMFGRG